MNTTKPLHVSRWFINQRGHYKCLLRDALEFWRWDTLIGMANFVEIDGWWGEN